jgi:hypothetical protein
LLSQNSVSVRGSATGAFVTPRWARDRPGEIADLLREQIRSERTPTEALNAWDAFTARVPSPLTSAHAYLAAARPHTFTCLDPALRARLTHLGGPELGTGVLERLMRELEQAHRRSYSLKVEEPVRRLRSLSGFCRPASEPGPTQAARPTKAAPVTLEAAFAPGPAQETPIG